MNPVIDPASHGRPSSPSHDGSERPSVVVEHGHLSLTGTRLSACVLISGILFITWLHLSVPPVDRIASPERALALMVGRTMELEMALDRVSTWERWLYDMTTETGVDELVQSITWYEELAAVSSDPVVQVQLAVLEAEAGRLNQVDQKTLTWAHRAEPFPMFARLLRAAYVETRVASADERDLLVELAETLQEDWFYYRLAIGLTKRAGDASLLAESQAELAARAALLLWRIRVLTAIQLAIILIGIGGMVFLLKLARQGKRAWLSVGAAPLPPPWHGRTGLAVLVRGGALAVVITVAFLFLDVDDPWIRLSAVPLASLPLLVLAQRYLLTPAGLHFGNGFGLQPIGSGWRRLGLALIVLIAVGLLGEWGLGFIANRFNFSSHWTEWFDADLVWGEGSVLVISLLEFVVFAPVFEEIGFRGLLYGTLRRRFGLGPSAVLSAGLFAAAHGYGVVGFASVFWSGLLWAWMYEKTGSLLPGMLAHALNNLLVCLTMIWLLR